jgi:hypothetical protein
MNLLVAPGLTLPTLTGHMVNVCEERADAMAIIDLPDVYIPTHEQKLTKPNRRSQTTPSTAANSLRDRRIDSSYGCTFYPWVQTRDEPTGQLLWIPPSVAMWVFLLAHKQLQMFGLLQLDLIAEVFQMVPPEFQLQCHREINS